MTDAQQRETFSYRRSPDQERAEPPRHDVVVVGAGPVGLTVALDLARRGVPAVILDDDDRLAAGSRAICFAKRTLEIWDRLGVGAPIVEKGIKWQVGKVFHKDRLAYAFDLLPEDGHKQPAFVNVSQNYVENVLVEAVRREPLIDLRWRNKVVGLVPRPEGVVIEVATPDGPYRLDARYVIAADGAKSATRGLLGLEPKGQTFQDRFLIADVHMRADFPTERWFWFDPPFHPGQSVLLHRQPDDIWRIDFQLGADADPRLEREPSRILPRVKSLLGPDTPFELVWASIYTFSCERLDTFRHGRVIFMGDAAHRVSPFGARGANGGVQDAENLAWKLALVLDGTAPDDLLDSYGAEREPAADENILNSTRATDFISPKSPISRVFRDEVLRLARAHPFARRLVNSGRLSVPSTYDGSPLNSEDDADFNGLLRPGAPALDAPIVVDGRHGWLLNQLTGHFTLLVAGIPASEAEDLAKAAALSVPVEIVSVAGPGASPGPRQISDPTGKVTQRYDLKPGTAYLLRPDQHVAARWRHLSSARLKSALNRAIGHGPGTEHNP